MLLMVYQEMSISYDEYEILYEGYMISYDECEILYDGYMISYDHQSSLFQAQLNLTLPSPKILFQPDLKLFTATGFQIELEICTTFATRGIQDENPDFSREWAS